MNLINTTALFAAAEQPPTWSYPVAIVVGLVLGVILYGVTGGVMAKRYKAEKLYFIFCEVSMVIVALAFMIGQGE